MCISCITEKLVISNHCRSGNGQFHKGKLNKDVMEWMINTQLGRRNLSPQQRIAVVKKFEKKIREQGKENQSEAGRNFGNGKNSSSPNGEKLNDKKIRTDKELAKLANVGTGIVRFNRVAIQTSIVRSEKYQCRIQGTY